MTDDARARVHALADRLAAAAAQFLRLQAAAHRSALAGKNFNRSLAQYRRQARQRETT